MTGSNVACSSANKTSASIVYLQSGTLVAYGHGGTSILQKYGHIFLQFVRFKFIRFSATYPRRNGRLWCITMEKIPSEYKVTYFIMEFKLKILTIQRCEIENDRIQVYHGEFGKYIQLRYLNIFSPYLHE